MPAPADKPDYPSGDDLLGFLSGSGVAVPSGQDLDLAVAAAVNAFERLTGRNRPGMLAATKTYHYNPPTRPSNVIDLQRDLLAVTSLTVAGAPKVEGTDYILLPLDADQDGRPFERLRFTGSVRYYDPLPVSAYRSVVIQGTWGYKATLPNDAFLAMLRGAALQLVFGSVDPGDGRGPVPAFARAWEAVSRTTEGYDTDFLFTRRDEWQAGFNGAVSIYRRVGVG